MSFKFEDNSDKVYKNMLDATDAGMEAALLLIEAQAKQLAPVDLGELRDTLDHKIKKKGDGFIGTVGSPKDYAVHVEYGTGEFAENGKGRKGGWGYTDEEGVDWWTYGQHPQPFLRPAFRENKQNIIDILGKSYGAKF